MRSRIIISITVAAITKPGGKLLDEHVNTSDPISPRTYLRSGVFLLYQSTLLNASEVQTRKKKYNGYGTTNSK
jgi:hypothetical protein